METGIIVWRVQSVTTEIFGEEWLGRAPKLFWTPGSPVLSLCKLGSRAACPASLPLICAVNVVLKIILKKLYLLGWYLQGILVSTLSYFKIWKKIQVT